MNFTIPDQSNFVLGDVPQSQLARDLFDMRQDLRNVLLNGEVIEFILPGAVTVDPITEVVTPGAATFVNVSGIVQTQVLNNNEYGYGGQIIPGSIVFTAIYDHVIDYLTIEYVRYRNEAYEVTERAVDRVWGSGLVVDIMLKRRPNGFQGIL